MMNDSSILMITMMIIELDLVFLFSCRSSRSQMFNRTADETSRKILRKIHD